MSCIRVIDPIHRCMQDTLQETEVQLVPVSSVVSLGIGQMHVPISSGDIADKSPSGRTRRLLTFL